MSDTPTNDGLEKVTDARRKQPRQYTAAENVAFEQQTRQVADTMPIMESPEWIEWVMNNIHHPAVDAMSARSRTIANKLLVVDQVVTRIEELRIRVDMLMEDDRRMGGSSRSRLLQQVDSLLKDIGSILS